MIRNILAATLHRPYPLPPGPWIYYQEWNRVVFLHWEANAKLLQALLPAGLELALFEGKPWISLVFFDMQRIRPRFVPPVQAVSDFLEVNVRTYVIRDGRPGVYFLSMEGSGKLVVTLAKGISGLPYQYAQMEREDHNFSVRNPATQDAFDIHYEIGEVKAPTPLDRWLTERYCLYFDRGKHLCRYDIHHHEWPLHALHIQEMNMQYAVLQKLIVPETLQIRYSPGVQVLAWRKQKLQ